MPTGKVKYFDAYEGYGYITRDDHDDDTTDEEVYVESSSVTDMEPLEAGQAVEFEVSDSGKEAIDVKTREADPA